MALKLKFADFRVFESRVFRGHSGLRQFACIFCRLFRVDGCGEGVRLPVAAATFPPLSLLISWRKRAVLS